jgi:hypothetical protein
VFYDFVDALSVFRELLTLYLKIKQGYDKDVSKKCGQIFMIKPELLC